MHFISLLLFFSFQAQPGTTADEAKLARIEGRAVHAVSGEPVRKVQLTLRKRSTDPMQAQGGRTAVTDDEGKFSFDKLEPGTYSLFAERSGFLRQEYGARGNSYMGTPLTLGAGDHLRDITFKLTPQGVIAGKVVNDEGEPVQYAQVSVLRQGGSGGQPMMTMGSSTNDLGEFRLAELAPGRYLVQATPRMMFGPAQSAPPEGDKRREALLPTYYPGTTDVAGASAIEVAPGQQVAGITIQLRKGSVYRVSGKLAGPPAAGRMTQVMLMPRQRSNSMMYFGGMGNMMKPDGTFDIQNVRPGSYYIVAMRRSMDGPDRPQQIARAPVDVSDQDVKDVLLQPEPPVEITGTVRVEGEQPVSTAGMRITLVPAEGVPFNVPMATVEESGAFKLTGVMPDRYHLSFYGVPETCYVRSARIGSEDALRSGFQAGAGGKLEIVLRPGSGTAAGIVQQQDKPVPGAFVMLAPEPFGPETAWRRKTGSSDQNGRFEIKGVAPGAYRVYAWLEPQIPFPADGEALKPVENKSVKITVAENGNEQTIVRVIEPAKQ